MALPDVPLLALVVCLAVRSVAFEAPCYTENSSPGGTDLKVIFFSLLKILLPTGSSKVVFFVQGAADEHTPTTRNKIHLIAPLTVARYLEDLR